MASRYCSTSDLYDFGVPRGSLSATARLCAGASTTSDQIELDGHGLADGERVTFREESGALPAPLVEGTQYYAIEVDDSHFQVSETEEGSAINITTAGTYFMLVQSPDPYKWIEFASALIEDSLPAHVVPVPEPIPEIVKMTCAELAAAKGMAMQGRGSDTLAKTIDQALARVARWGKSIPLRGEIVPKQTALAAIGAPSRVDARGFRNCRDSLP